MAERTATDGSGFEVGATATSALAEPKGFSELLANLEAALGRRLDSIDQRLVKLLDIRFASSAPIDPFSCALVEPSYFCGPTTVGGAYFEEPQACFKTPLAMMPRWSEATTDLGTPVDPKTSSNAPNDIPVHHLSFQSVLFVDHEGSTKTPRRSSIKGHPVIATFELREEWRVRGRATDKVLIEEAALDFTDFGTLDKNLRRQFSPRTVGFIMRPASQKRLVLDLFALCLIFYDLVVTPFSLAFPIDDTSAATGMFWLSLLFWTAEIPRNFLTGYFIGGVEELRLSRIALAYVKSWLLFDILVVGMDWAFLFAGLGARTAAVARAGKMLKMVRMLRLVRVAKLRAMLETIQDHFASEHFHIGVNMLKHTLLVLFMNHFIACAWYGLGSSLSDELPVWVEAGHFEEQSAVAYKYLTAFHWSLTQFTPASMEVFPRNVPERAFAVCVLVFALLVFSSFLGSITATMTQLRKLSSWFDPNMSMLRRFLWSRKVPSSLTTRVLKYVEHRLAMERQEIQEKDVIVLRLLSKPLQMELKYQMHEGILRKHPFFDRCALANQGALRLICTALSIVNYSTDDAVFAKETSGDSMYILMKGTLRYRLRSRVGPGRSRSMRTTSLSLSPARTATGADDTPESQDIAVGQWFCEAALWTTWVHFGTMKALENSEVIAVDARSMAEVCRQHRRVVHSAAKYGRMFVARLNERAEDSDEVLNDLTADSSLEDLQLLAEEAFYLSSVETQRPCT